jgi:hypothetical protein
MYFSIYSYACIPPAVPCGIGDFSGDGKAFGTRIKPG